MDTLPKPLAVLIVEDMESDAQLLVRLLTKAGYDLVYKQVETAEQMRVALGERDWDIIISDYKLPQFDGLAALNLLHETGCDIPFIVVSGVIGEETAVSMMRAGAHDYLIKGNLARLIPAVERELNQARVRHEQKRMEEARIASEAELRALFSSIQDAVLVIDRQGVYRKIAPTHRQFLAKPAGELLGKNLWDAFPTGQAELFMDTIQKVLETGQTSRIVYELFIEHRPVWFEASVSSMGGDNTLWMVRDITERRMAEKALRESEEKYRTLFDSLPDAVTLIGLDGRILVCNEATAKLAGLPKHKLLGSHFTKLGVLNVAELPKYLSLFSRLLAGDQVNHLEVEIKRPDGNHRLEVFISLLTVAGHLNSLQVIARDITGQLQDKEALAASEAKLRALVEQVPVIVYTESAKTGETTYISPQVERITGYTPDEWMQDPGGWKKLIFPSDLDSVLEADQYTSQSHQPFQAEYRLQTRDGRVIWIRDEAVVIEQDGEALFWQGVMYDITERKQAEEFLQKSEERYRGLFNSMIDGFALHEIICDENGKPVDYRFLEVNSAFERLTGLKSDDLIGRTVLEVLPHTEKYWIEMYGNVALTGRSTFFENYSGDLGHYFEVSAYSPSPGQFAIVMEDVTERRHAEEGIHHRVAQLEMLYQSGLALSQLLNPKEIGEKILELLEEKLNWRHTRIRLYHPEDDVLELLDFNRPGLTGLLDRHGEVERFQFLITRSGQGMSGWVVQHGRSVRCGDVTSDPRYVEAYPGIHSGLYVPMKLGERIVGVISIEDERKNAFSEADERLIVTLANQAASAFENARLFEEIHKRVRQLETLNRISLVMRSVSNQKEMLSIVLDEALAILNTSHGSIELYDKSGGIMDRIVTRGWLSRLPSLSQGVDVGIIGKVFTSGEIYISREFSKDPELWYVLRDYVPSDWGGICLPIHTTQQTLGVMIVAVPSEHELDKDDIRLLSILSEMTGAALQRMQLYEQTVRRLDQLNALRAVDQAISNSLDMRLTLNILLTQTISQLKVDAASVFLRHADSNILELTASRGYRTFLSDRISLSGSFAGRAILEHRSVMALDLETANQDALFGKLWREEGFLRYWCVPLVVKGEVKGVLEVYCRSEFTPDGEWVEFLEAFAGQAAIAIDNTQLFENLQRANMDLSLAYDATIEGWSRALDLRDHETEGHTLRVTDLTLKLARAMQVSESQLTSIRRGALLHDIGKMGVPDSILLKEGELTTEEWEIMRQHPQLAHDMLTPIAYLNNALDIPYCHHEKWDGTGYPQGLKGTQIPLAARIFAVVDVWDALTNDRTYRKKWSHEKAWEFIKSRSGTHFDPQVVEVFLRDIVGE
jgi:PAS domain S-box-containing protein/putative nucleotidyltransferase with HDIG domain